MKFKYNFLERRLWKIEDNYLYEISEDNYFHTPQGVYGTDGFRLGEKKWITFTFSHSNLKVHYQKGSITYQKTLDLPNAGEITFAFTENDQKEVN